MLLETHQIRHPTGKKRERNIPVAEKFQPDEDTVQAARRGIREVCLLCISRVSALVVLEAHLVRITRGLALDALGDRKSRSVRNI